jgi:hypothetical protein
VFSIHISSKSLLLVLIISCVYLYLLSMGLTHVLTNSIIHKIDSFFCSYISIL